MVSIVAYLALHPATSLAGAPETYEQLKLLAGEWEAELPGFGKLTSSVRVVSNGKAIEEIIGTPKDNELSIYTLNDDRILLMHYCAMTPDGHRYGCRHNDSVRLWITSTFVLRVQPTCGVIQRRTCDE